MAAATKAASTRRASSPSSGCWSIPTSCCAFTAILSRQPANGAAASARIGCPISSLHRGCRFSCGPAFPDDQLLTLAEQRKLSEPRVLEQQVRRMLADPRSTEALVDDFAAQWLNLRRVAEVVVDPERYPNYDLTLMDAFKRKPSSSSPARCARTAACSSCSTPTTRSSTKARASLRHPWHLRQPLPARDVARSDSARRACLRRARCSSTTSYPDRTSPVLRGKFLLNNIFGLQSPPPPPGVDTNLAPVKPGGAPPTIRERLARAPDEPDVLELPRRDRSTRVRARELRRHRRWRTVDEAGKPVDAAGHDDERDATSTGCAGCARCCSSTQISSRAP